MEDLSLWGRAGQAAFAVATGFVLLGLGWPFIRSLDRGQALHDAERAGVAFLLSAFAVYFGVFLIGTWWLNPYGMGALALGLVVAAVPGWLSLPWARTGHFVAAEARAACGRPLRSLLWLALFGVALSGLVQGLAPPNDYDSLMYHLSLPQLDVEAGRRIHAWSFGAGTAKTLFPEMMGHLSRLALALAGAGAAQTIHGLFSVVAAGAAAALARRAGASLPVSALAALLFLACRAVVWEMGSVEVDAPLAAFAGFALVAYLAWRGTSERRLGTMALFGGLIGGGILVKYHGFAIALAFTPLMAFDLLRTRAGMRIGTLAGLALGAVGALAVVLPHLVRNALQSGNPLFPLFQSVFNPGAPEIYADTASIYGTGRGLLDLAFAPWTLSVLPLHFYDGMVLGAPYLLAFVPLVLLREDRGRALGAMLSVAGVYFVEWFWLLSQQVRFLLPVVPVLAAAAAIGAASLWCRVRPVRPLRVAAVAGFAAFTLVQFLFVGIYALVRLPPALGLVSAADYHTKTPTLTGANYATCTFIRQRLRPGERYWSDIHPHSTYCPQAQAVWRFFDDESRWWLASKTPPPMPFDEFLRRAEAMDFRFFITPTAFENRRNDTAEAHRIDVDLAAETRFGAALGPAFTALEPLIRGPFSAVYDGPQVIAWLKAHRESLAPAVPPGR